MSTAVEPSPPVQSRFSPDETAEKLEILRAVADFVQAYDLPLPGAVQVSRRNGHRRDGGLGPPWAVKVTWVRSVRDLAAWAHALGVDTVMVRTPHGHYTYLDVRGDAAGIAWTLHGQYPVRLGARADVQWGTRRDGKREQFGDMTLAALEALPEVDEAAAP